MECFGYWEKAENRSGQLLARISPALAGNFIFYNILQGSSPLVRGTRCNKYRIDIFLAMAA
jgi:hypothetical protein